MVKTVEAPLSSIYLSKRNDELRKIIEKILCGETINYEKEFSISFIVVGDLKRKWPKALIDNTYFRCITLFDKSFYSTAEKLALSYEEITKKIRSNFGLLERLFIPKENWIIKKSYKENS